MLHNEGSSCKSVQIKINGKYEQDRVDKRYEDHKGAITEPSLLKNKRDKNIVI